jgi:hypothetical protein
MHGTLIFIGAHNQCESFFSKGIDKDLILIINFFNLQFLWFWHHLIIFSIWIFYSILCNTSYTIWLSYKSLWVNVLLTSNTIGVIYPMTYCANFLAYRCHSFFNVGFIILKCYSSHWKCCLLSFVIVIIGWIVPLGWRLIGWSNNVYENMANLLPSFTRIYMSHIFW